MRTVDRKTQQETFRLDSGVNRIIYFVFVFVVSTHIMACLWIGMSLFYDHNWLVLKLNGLQGIGEEITDRDYMQIYCISLYFTI
jgi:hypothetical protein